MLNRRSISIIILIQLAMLLIFDAVQAENENSELDRVVMMPRGVNHAIDCLIDRDSIIDLPENIDYDKLAVLADLSRKHLSIKLYFTHMDLQNRFNLRSQIWDNKIADINADEISIRLCTALHLGCNEAGTLAEFDIPECNWGDALPQLGKEICYNYLIDQNEFHFKDFKILDNCRYLLDSAENNLNMSIKSIKYNCLKKSRNIKMASVHEMFIKAICYNGHKDDLGITESVLRYSTNLYLLQQMRVLCHSQDFPDILDKNSSEYEQYEDSLTMVYENNIFKRINVGIGNCIEGLKAEKEFLNVYNASHKSSPNNQRLNFIRKLIDFSLKKAQTLYHTPPKRIF